MKQLAILAAFAVVIALPATVQAQCSYRMYDVGRPHGYLSGPCNGAAQGYSGVLPAGDCAQPCGQSKSDTPCERG